MDLSALLPLLNVEPLLQNAFDSIAYPAILEEVSKIPDAVLKQAVLDIMPGVKSAIDGALQAALGKPAAPAGS